MSAVVCGKRSLFEEIHPPIQKRVRCGGGSPVRATSCRSPVASSEADSSSTGDLLSQLKNLFPDMDDKLIEKVLESSGDNIDIAIRSLHGLRLSSDRGENVEQLATGNVTSSTAPVEQTHEEAALGVTCSESIRHDEASPSEGSKWVELFVQEMVGASNIDDAKGRAARALEVFEKAVITRNGSLFENIQKENIVLKEQLQTLIRDNQILKRAVAIQHERQAEHERCSQDIQQLKQLIAQYQEQIRTLEVNNYALNLHLRKAQEGSSMPGRFHPDIF